MNEQNTSRMGRGDEAQGTEGFYRKILESLSVGVYFVDLDRRITYWNEGAEQLSGYRREEVVGRSCRDNILVHTDAEGCQLCLTGCPLLAAFHEGNDQKAEVFMKHKAGHRVPVAVRVSPIKDGEGRVVGGVEVFSENGEKLAALAKAVEMEQMAMVDPLTGVGNRRFGEMTLREAAARHARDGEPYAVIFADLDHFKGVNDGYGHDAGDAVLRAVAQTLAGNLRSFDYVGRWGGEEFLIVLGRADGERAAAAARRCCALVRSCGVDWEGSMIRSTVSMGVAVAGEGEKAEDVVARADARVYEAKRAGRDQVKGP
jgi:diguanylate cyclase (GGDEF)-like protein/PAS domain S-box-containing protein